MSLVSVIKELGMGAAGRVLGALPLGGRVAAGADRFNLSRRPRPPGSGRGSKFQILVYHRVLPERDPFAISPVSVAEFDAQMALLRSRFRAVSLDRLLEELDGGRLQPGTVCVTFDDGYRDNHDHALPVLKRHGIPATVYLATGFIGTRECPWYDKVLGAMRRATAGRLEYGPPELVGRPLADPARRAEAAYRLLEWFKGFPPAERDARIAELARVLQPADGGAGEERLMLDWNEVRRMHGSGVAFGGHTVTHPILSTVGPGEAEKEIRGSRQAIEEALQAPVRHFAYPNGRVGDYDAGTMDLLARLGFVSAVTTNPGVNGPGQNRYEWLRRQPWERDAGSMYFRMVLERLAA